MSNQKQSELEALIRQSNETVESLLADGIESDTELTIEHHLVSTDFAKLEKAAVELVKGGFHVEDAEEFKLEDGARCFYFAALTHSTPDAKLLAEETQEVFEIAHSCGVEYEGWGTFLGDEEE